MKISKTYIGTKIIQAEPMDENVFVNKIKGEPWDPKRPVREGYKVIYPDGYISWSPKDVFETSYREITDSEKALI